MPALFLECRPCSCNAVSRRDRLTGRTVDAVMALSLAECGGCFALGGGFFADIDGDGDDFEEIMAPFVWIPGGIGRFTLLATFCWVIGPTGAIVL
jgi:hypothetical protein